MLKRFQLYVRENPVQGWLLEVALTAALYLALWALFSAFRPQPIPQGLWLLFGSFVLTPPTIHLLRRFSGEERNETPVRPGQERAVGTLGFALALGGVSAMIAAIFGKRVGIVVPDDGQFYLLMLSSIALMLSVGLGIAVRYTHLGRVTLWLSAGWLTLLVAAGYATILRQ